MYFCPVRSVRNDVTTPASVSFWCSSARLAPGRKKDTMPLAFYAGA